MSGSTAVPHLADPAFAATAGELARWMLRDSRLPTGFASLPGESERPFGLELEFVFDPTLMRREREERLQRIVDDLRRLGLTRQTTVGGEHSARAAGYVSVRSGWHVEDDHTVDGEVVSPILPYRDGTPAQREQIWFDVATVLGVIRRNGGQASQRVGGHVHVGIGDYGRDVDSLIRLIDTFRAHQDSLYRLATASGERFHRGTFHCRPIEEPPRRPAPGRPRSWHDFLAENTGDYDDALSRVPLHRGYLAGDPADADHVEFRLWDGALSLGDVRAHVALSRSMADAALAGRGLGHSSPEMGTGFLHPDPYGAYDAAALQDILRLFPRGASDLLRGQLTHWWRSTAWQPPGGSLHRQGQFLWETTDPVRWNDWEGLNTVAAGFPELSIAAVYAGAAASLSTRTLEKTLQGWVDGAVGAATNAATRSIIIAIADPSRVAALDVLPERFGASLVRPVAGAGHVAPAPPSGWFSSTGWELVTRGHHYGLSRVPLGDAFGPVVLRQMLEQRRAAGAA